MFTVKIAGLYVQICNRHKFIENMCRDYIVRSPKCDFSVYADDEDMAKEAEIARAHGKTLLPQLLESSCIYRKICTEIYRFDAFFIHAAAVSLDGEAYAFTAPSGTGKSTHAALWIKHFGDRAFIVNGDKPICRFFDGALYVCGTPWCGKEGKSKNAVVPLKALYFFERSEQNRVRRVPGDEIISRLFSQVLVPCDEQRLDLFFKLINRLLSDVPMFVLGCGMDESAVLTAYGAANEL
jgi:hypothetical protein